MRYQDAVAVYQKNPKKETLQEQCNLLIAEMTLKEKIHMLSGHPIAQIQKDMIKTGRNYNVHALPAGGCKRLGIPPFCSPMGPGVWSWEILPVFRYPC